MATFTPPGMPGPNRIGAPLVGKVTLPLLKADAMDPVVSTQTPLETKLLTPENRRLRRQAGAL